ncbi:hypothetical protein JIG36_45545 [Actinoplanes sp. LDG1-06]|uniref:Integral membrane protein n=1 Tax=Paractinoplanes ovalisporus TaxID=2810368 RepID=A0ABS2AUD2_9ACTN|nr:hypothetical protein [Actinoplanes ovalisporus]MBM2622789.1 hypothetical protein [Actinoplanes ovalisporus]
MAENYGQLSGVLAGFAFTALVLLLSRDRERRHAVRGGVPLLLFVAFLTLIINTVMYSVLAGDSAQPRAASAQVINGLSFGLSIAVLLQGITLLIQEAGHDRATIGVARFSTVALLPCLGLYFVLTGLTDIERARAQLDGTCVPVAASTEGLVLCAGALVIPALSLHPGAQNVPPLVRRFSRTAAPPTVLVLTVAAAIAGSDISNRSPEFVFSATTSAWFQRGAFAILVVLGLMLSFGGLEQARTASHRARLIWRETPAKKR